MLKEDDELQQNENESATEEYEFSIRATGEVAKEVLPQMKGTRRQQISDDI